VRSVLDPVPSVVPLLTMIRLIEDVIAEVQKRRCSPLESFVFSLRLQMWPVFQKAMSEHVESIKKLAEGSGAGFFSKGPSTTDESVSKVMPSIFFFDSYAYNFV
jgi:vacuolar protein sorting-associated protein 52